MFKRWICVDFFCPVKFDWIIGLFLNRKINDWGAACVWPLELEPFEKKSLAGAAYKNKMDLEPQKFINLKQRITIVMCRCWKVSWRCRRGTGWRCWPRTRRRWAGSWPRWRGPKGSSRYRPRPPGSQRISLSKQSSLRLGNISSNDCTVYRVCTHAFTQRQRLNIKLTIFFFRNCSLRIDLHNCLMARLIYYKLCYAWF